MNPDDLQLLAWLTAENSYWNNVALWLHAEGDYGHEQFFGVPRSAGAKAAWDAYSRKCDAARASA